MALITLDFETYYSREYSLSKMTTEQYIRDPQFQVIGFAYRIDHGDPVWVTGDDERIAAALKVLDLDNHSLVAHNAAFDAAILSWRYGIHPKNIFDTLSMARPVTGMTVGGSLAALAKKFCLGEKGTEVVNALGLRREQFSPEQLAAYGQYCINDVVLTHNLFYILSQYSTAQEMYIIDMMLRMFTDPVVELNRHLLKVHLADVQARKAKLLDKIDQSVGRDELMSNPKFASILAKLGVSPPMKVSLTTGKETYAFSKTDQAFKDLLEHPDERVQAVVAARLGIKSTLEETRTESFIGISERGRLPIMLNYYGANTTGRACLTGDTTITVMRKGFMQDIRLDELENDDFVWDGTGFVSHDGLIDQGEKPVMYYQGITGTPDHRVFTDEDSEAIELREASLRGYTLKDAGLPADYQTNTFGYYRKQAD